MNIRANIMYFLEYLCDMAARENHWDYVRMIQRDILRIVDAVAPEDGSGAANVKVVRKVLKALEIKTFLLAQTVGEIEECLKERDIAPDTVGLSSPLGPQEGRNGDGKEASTPTGKGAKATPFGKLDRKQAEQRIEEDRERHKRQRETAWAVSRDENEFERVWNETGELGEDDFEMWKEEAEERARAGREWKEEYLGRIGGSGGE
jgi:CTD kinase subunit gamma